MVDNSHSSVRMDHSHTRILRGFTLIEMALSMSLFGIVLVSLGTMLALTMQAAPKPDDAATQIRNTSYPAAFMAEELAAATEVLSVSPTGISFRTADRTGDGLPETVGYSWSGKPGAPLIRKINGKESAELIASVQSVSFDAQIETHIKVTNFATSGIDFAHEINHGLLPFGGGTPPSEEDGGLLDGVLDGVNGGLGSLNSRLVTLREGEGLYQTMRIEAVPDDALYWIPTYAEVRLEKNATPGTVRLELRIDEGNEPTNIVVASTVLHTTVLGDENWIKIEVPGSLKLSPQTRLGLTVISLSGDRTTKIRTMQQILFPSEAPASRTVDGGISWSTLADARVAYRLEGSYFERVKQESVSESTVRSIRFAINPTATSATALSTSVDLPAPVRYGP